MFITFEGIDGCGKSTQVKLLEKYLKEQNLSVLVTREPGGTEFAEKCRELLKEYSDSISGETQVFLLSAARRDHYEKVLKPNLKTNDFVICDRYIDSFTVYQGFGQKRIHPELIRTLAYWSIGSCFPDLTFLLDIEPEIALERIKKRKERDYFDSEKIEFFNIIRDAYKDLAHNNYIKCNEEAIYPRIVTIDASKSIEEIHNEILNKIGYLLKIVSSENNCCYIKLS